jgi:hypothetical protein
MPQSSFRDIHLMLRLRVLHLLRFRRGFQGPFDFIGHRWNPRSLRRCQPVTATLLNWIALFRRGLLLTSFRMVAAVSGGTLARAHAGGAPSARIFPIPFEQRQRRAH